MSRIDRRRRHHHHHHHRQNSPFRAMAFLRRFRVFTSWISQQQFIYTVRPSALRPTFLPLTRRVRSLYLCPPVTGWPSYTPRHRVSFSSPPTTRRATVEAIKPASTQECTERLYTFTWSSAFKNVGRIRAIFEIVNKKYFKICYPNFFIC
jgi:hypothetical protein